MEDYYMLLKTPSVQPSGHVYLVNRDTRLGKVLQAEGYGVERMARGRHFIVEMQSALQLAEKHGLAPTLPREATKTQLLAQRPIAIGC